MKNTLCVRDTCSPARQFPHLHAWFAILVLANLITFSPFALGHGDNHQHSATQNKNANSPVGGDNHITPSDDFKSTSDVFALPPGFDSQNILLNTQNPVFAPTKMTIAQDGRIFIAAQAGTLHLVKDSALSPTPVLTLADVFSTGDGGFQSVALDPDFSTTGKPGSGRFYTVHHHLQTLTDKATAWPRISIYRMTSETTANPTPEAIVDLSPISNIQGKPIGSHVAATLQVGNDGALYVALGMQDGTAEDCLDWSKSTAKILRMDRATLAPLPDNPFAKSGVNDIQKRIWARGTRNPFNLAVDRVTGEMFFDDVGSNDVVSPNPKGAFEETNSVPNPGQQGFINQAPYDFGWPNSEGTGPNLIHRYLNGLANENTGGQDCAKIGGDFYRPQFAAFPAEFIGAYFYADFCSTYIRYIPDDPQISTTTPDGIPTNNAKQLVATTGVAITDIETHPDGSIYVLGRAMPERLGTALGYLHRVFTSGPVPQVTITSPEDGHRFMSKKSGRGVVDIPITVSASDSNGTITRIDVLLGNTLVGSCNNSPCKVTAKHLSRGTYVITGRATNSLGNSKATNPLSVTVDGPQATINTPVVGSNFVAGTSVAFSGAGKDSEGKIITDPSAYEWTIYLRHGTHQHLEKTFIGQSGEFTLPHDTETADNIALNFVLTVKDRAGVAHATSRLIQPIKPTLTIATQPFQNMTVKLDSSFKTSNYAFLSVAGVNRIIFAASCQLNPADGHHYYFQNWAHGGQKLQTITTPLEDTTYTAIFHDAVAAGTGLKGEYFADTQFKKRKATTVESVNLDWGNSSPKPGIPQNGFTVRWSGMVLPYCSEGYNFYVEAQGGVRLWVKDKLIIDSWNETKTQRMSDVFWTRAGSSMNIVLEYINTKGPASVKLSWASSVVAKELIPATQLFEEKKPVVVP